MTEWISTRQLRNAKVGVTAAFVAHAVMFSSWAAHIPAVQAKLDLSNAELGSSLFGAPLGSVVAMVLSHCALPRWGSHRLVPIAVAGYSLAGMTIGLAISGPWLFAALALWGMFQGGLDVAMNTQAAAVERLIGTAIMARFHGIWSAGAFLGALIGGAAVSADVGLTAQLAVMGVVVLVVVGALNRRLIPDHHTELTREDAPKRAWMTTAVAILGAVSFASLLCEGAAADWSATYLHNVVGHGQGAAALGYAAYTLTMVITRFGGVRLQSCIPSRRLLPVLALLAAVGMGVALVSANPVLSVVGFAMLGAGVALLVPTAFSAAYSATATGGSAIAIVAATGWLGYVMGPPLIGHLAALVGLQAALITLPVMMSVAGIAVYCTSAFDAVDRFHREPAVPTD
ncbi:Inner membrane protein YbjJ [Mycobacterium simulans]|uniref:MFS transporter n=1 Tax=Mycobacterium simulans TaxID=627089 RepID=UPI001748170D|nr:MFS transporter [Mycobacterium simulans]SON59109.1 Inner membrane protein YbjJ [Mycobacterium simulans]